MDRSRLIMRRIILDTDAASLSTKRQLPPTLLRELMRAQVGITFVTLGELTGWATIRQWGTRKRSELSAVAECASDAALQR